MPFLCVHVCVCVCVYPSDNSTADQDSAAKLDTEVCRLCMCFEAKRSKARVTKFSNMTTLATKRYRALLFYFEQVCKRRGDGKCRADK